MCNVSYHTESGACVFPTDLPSDCSDLFSRGGRGSGVYALKPTNLSGPFMAFCDMSKGIIFHKINIICKTIYRNSLL